MSYLPKQNTNILADPQSTETLNWLNTPASFTLANERLTIVPLPESDFFRSPKGAEPRDNAPYFHWSVTGDFSVRTHVRALLTTFGDAGGLTIRKSSQTWAKLCIERSPTGEVGIISVVTRQISDDTNNELLADPEADLRISRIGNLFGMHYSKNGIDWRFVRAFQLPVENDQSILVGVHAQNPYGTDCTVNFDNLIFSREVCADFRSGK